MLHFSVLLEKNDHMKPYILEQLTRNDFRTRPHSRMLIRFLVFFRFGDFLFQSVKHLFTLINAIKSNDYDANIIYTVIHLSVSTICCCNT